MFQKPRTLAAFDPVMQTLVTGRRDETTVPSQALFMLNSPFVRSQSLHVAESLLTEKHRSDAARIREAYQRVLGRDPGTPDTARVKAFLARYSATWLELHPAATPPGQAHIVRASSSSSSITEGIVRSDDLDQDDEVDAEPIAEEAAQIILPDTGEQAAWAAFVQALFGSAEFQFVR
jgi:hypothetical protein